MKRQRLGQMRLSSKRLTKADSLVKFFELQAELQGIVAAARGIPNIAEPEKMTEAERVRWAKDYLLCIMVEAAEALDWLPWKWWKTPKPLTRTQRHECLVELVDILHFWINVCLLLEAQPEELRDLFFRKQMENRARQRRGY